VFSVVLGRGKKKRREDSWGNLFLGAREGDGEGERERRHFLRKPRKKGKGTILRRLFLFTSGWAACEKR